MSTFHSLPVIDIHYATEESVVISLEVPPALKDDFQYLPGQYLTIRKEMNGEEVRRAYSMCSSPFWDEPLRIGVKRVEGGLMSTFLHSTLSVGDELEVMAPAGRFTVNPDPDRRKTYVLIAAGSGITPMLSILKSVIEEEPKSQVLLLYGNRNDKSVMFLEELKSLEKRYTGQLEVTHILSKPGRSGGIFGWMNGQSIDLDATKGRIDAPVLKRLLDAHPIVTDTVGYYICGPGNMNEVVREALIKRGVGSESIHIEHFSSHHLPHEQVAQGDVAGAELTVHLDGQTFKTNIPAGVNILQHLLDEGYDPPYSCTSGSCASCIGKVVSGKARMEVCLALDEDEVAEGFILTCQAHPASDKLELTFEV